MPLRIIMPSITVAAQDGAALRLSGGEAHWRAIAHGSLSQVAAKHVALLAYRVGGHGRSRPAAMPGRLIRYLMRSWLGVFSRKLSPIPALLSGPRNWALASSLQAWEGAGDFDIAALGEIEQ